MYFFIIIFIFYVFILGEFRELKELKGVKDNSPSTSVKEVTKAKTYVFNYFKLLEHLGLLNHN